MRELDATLATFPAQLDQLLAWDLGVDSDIDVTVAQIIKEVRGAGDEQLLTLTRKFDRVDAQSMSELEIDKDELADAWARLDMPAQQALTTAADRIRRFHQRQRQLHSESQPQPRFQFQLQPQLSLRLRLQTPSRHLHQS